MRDDPPPCIFQPTWGALTRLRCPTLDHAVFYGAAFDLTCFLATVGFDAGRGIDKIAEIVPDLEAIVLRHDETAVMLLWDGAAIRLHVGKSADDPKLIEVEARAADAGHSFIAIVPERIRSWLAPRYADARH